MDKISKIISALFSPILVPTYGMAIAGTLTILHLLPVSLIWTAVGITFVITCLVPVTAIMAMYRTGYIKDPGLNERTEGTTQAPFPTLLQHYVMRAVDFSFIKPTLRFGSRCFLPEEVWHVS